MVEAARKTASGKSRRALIVGGLVIVTISLGLARFGLTASSSGAAGSVPDSSTFGKFIAATKATTPPDITFEDAEGHAVTLGDFHGKLVLLNLWATWCGPCVEEMPSLAHLSQKFSGQGLAVVAVSQDRGGLSTVQKFFQEHALTGLPIYLDKTAKTSNTLGARGLPTTILIDQTGHEIGRLEGNYDWDSEASDKLIRAYLKPPADAPSKT